MSAFVGKAGKHLFAKHLEQYAPPDPLYEFYTNDKGKRKRRERPLPPGLSKRDARILKSIRRRAHYLDKGFNFCGLRFGWTFFIGLIPVVGDVANISLNHFLVVRKAKQAELPPWLVTKMHVNNVVSAGVGFIPLVGDVFLAMYKANSRNAGLLEELLRIRGEEYLKVNVGPDGEVVLTSGADSQGTKGSTFLTKKKKGMSKSDREQVKPGSGVKEGEVVPTAPVAADQIDKHGEQQPSAVSATETAPGGDSAIELSPRTKAKDAVASAEAPNRRKISLFGVGKKTNVPEDHGRFIENVDA